MKLICIFLFTLALTACSAPSKKQNSSTETASKPAAAVVPAVKKEQQVKANPAGLTKVTCTHKTETRTLEVLKDSEGCKTEYTKSGETTTVATGNASGTYCSSVLEKIKGNLVNAGYTCN